MEKYRAVTSADEDNRPNGEANVRLTGIRELGVGGEASGDSGQADLQGVARRILFGHLGLVLALVVLGIAAGYGRSQFLSATSSATVRVALGATPTGVAQSTAVGDTARAIVTSPEVAVRVLTSLGRTDRDPAVLTREVDVQPLGSSAVVQLTVHDPDPDLAVALANAFAAELVRMGTESATMSAPAAALDAQIRRIDADIARVDVHLLSNTQEQLINQRSNLVQEKVALEAQRATLLTAPNQRPLPVVVDKAVRAQGDLDPRLSYGVAGGLAGLILGLLVAALIETLSPTLGGTRAVARSVHAPVIGHLRRPARPETSPEMTARLVLAAKAAGVHQLALVQAGSHIDLAPLAAQLKADLAAAPTPLHVIDMDGRSLVPFSSDGVGTGLVLVAPQWLKKVALEPVFEVLQITGWPLLGVMTYSPRGVGRN